MNKMNNLHADSDSADVPGLYPPPPDGWVRSAEDWNGTDRRSHGYDRRREARGDYHYDCRAGTGFDRRGWTGFRGAMVGDCVIGSRSDGVPHSS